MKALSLKLRPDVFQDVENVVQSLDVPRNAYINDALAFYNKLMKRRALARQLKRESALVSDTSMEMLAELELLDDFLE